MRLGLMSTANINRALLGGRPDGVEIAAVASRDGAKAQAYASEHGIARAHGSYEELLADDELDAVYISLPNGMHHEWTLKSIEAGKHVLVEKPYSRHGAEAEEAWDAADRAGLVVMEAFMWRHHPQAAKAREVVESGAIGRLREIRTTFSFPLFDHDNVRMVADLDGEVRFPGIGRRQGKVPDPDQHLLAGIDVGHGRLHRGHEVAESTLDAVALLPSELLEAMAERIAEVAGPAQGRERVRRREEERPGQGDLAELGPARGPTGRRRAAIGAAAGELDLRRARVAEGLAQSLAPDELGLAFLPEDVPGDRAVVQVQRDRPALGTHILADQDLLPVRSGAGAGLRVCGSGRDEHGQDGEEAEQAAEGGERHDVRSYRPAAEPDNPDSGRSWIGLLPSDFRIGGARRQTDPRPTVDAARRPRYDV